MSKTETRKRRVSARQRQKQKIMITGGLLLLLVILLGVVAFVSCGSKYADVSTSTIFILEDGKIVTTDLESFDEAKYDKDELKTFVKETIATYNEENGKNSIKQKGFEVKENVATLVVEYKDLATYKDFTGKEIYVGTVADAVKAGYTFEGDFAKTGEKATACTSDEILAKGDLKVVIVRANTTVSFDGELQYVSAVNTASYTENTVTIKPDTNILGVVAGRDTETTEETESTEGSEMVDGGAIDEGELEVGTEEEIVFDFGDEMDSNSNVYTYIIFK